MGLTQKLCHGKIAGIRALMRAKRFLRGGFRHQNRSKTEQPSGAGDFFNKNAKEI
jgi:hypothetical protein